LLVAPDDLAQHRHREVRLTRPWVPSQEKALSNVGAGAELLRPLAADAERVLGSGHAFEGLERAARVRQRDSHLLPARVGARLLRVRLRGGAAEGAVPLGGERLAEQHDVLGLELPPAAEAAGGHRAATAAGGWRTWHSG